MKLIDYNEIRKMFDEKYRRTAQLIRNGETHLNNLAEGYVGADKIIRGLPDVDAVEVVRCEKCLFYEEVEYYHPTDKNPTKNVCRLFKRQMQHDDFCSYGERRTE